MAIFVVTRDEPLEICTRAEYHRASCSRDLSNLIASSWSRQNQTCSLNYSEKEIFPSLWKRQKLLFAPKIVKHPLGWFDYAHLLVIFTALICDWLQLTLCERVIQNSRLHQYQPDQLMLLSVWSSQVRSIGRESHWRLLLNKDYWCLVYNKKFSILK